MSANVVSKLDIDVLVHVATFWPAGATVPRLPRPAPRRPGVGAAGEDGTARHGRMTGLC